MDTAVLNCGYCGSLATEAIGVRRAGVEDAGGSLLVEAGLLASHNLILWLQGSCRYFRDGLRRELSLVLVGRVVE